MTRPHAVPVFHPTRLVLGTLAALALLAAASAAAAAGDVLTSDQFAPGWQEHAKSLISLGPGAQVDRSRWFVPAILPRGEYVVVERNGDKAEVIDGARFSVRGGTSDQVIFLMPGVSNVQALPIADVPALRPHAPAGAAALR